MTYPTICSNNYMHPLPYHLTIIFNKSLTEGNFSDLMKLADAVPIHKSKGKVPNNKLQTNITTNYYVQVTGKNNL